MERYVSKWDNRLCLSVDGCRSIHTEGKSLSLVHSLRQRFANRERLKLLARVKVMVADHVLARNGFPDLSLNAV